MKLDDKRIQEKKIRGLKKITQILEVLQKKVKKLKTL